MCSNARFIDTVESHMDDLVCSFEDFVKKSLIIVSVGIGAVVVLLMYVLKIVTDRTAPSTPVSTVCNQAQTTEVDSKERQHEIVQDTKSKIKRSTAKEKPEDILVRKTTHSANTSPTASCCDGNDCDGNKYSMCLKSCTASKNSSSPTVSPNRPKLEYTNSLSNSKENKSIRPKVKLITQQNSCCSICCEEDSGVHDKN